MLFYIYVYNYEEDCVAEHDHLRKRYGKTNSDSPALLDIIAAFHSYRISLAYLSHSSCVTPHLFMFSSLAHQKDG
jgi:hypothetical protein